MSVITDYQKYIEDKYSTYEVKLSENQTLKFLTLRKEYVSIMKILGKKDYNYYKKRYASLKANADELGVKTKPLRNPSIIKDELAGLLISVGLTDVVYIKTLITDEVLKLIDDKAAVSRMSLSKATKQSKEFTREETNTQAMLSGSFTVEIDYDFETRIRNKIDTYHNNLLH